MSNNIHLSTKIRQPQFFMFSKRSKKLTTPLYVLIPLREKNSELPGTFHRENIALFPRAKNSKVLTKNGHFCLIFDQHPARPAAALFDSRHSHIVNG